MNKGFVLIRADILEETTDGFGTQQRIEINGVTGKQLAIILHKVLEELFHQFPPIRRRLMAMLLVDSLNEKFGIKDVETED